LAADCHPHLGAELAAFLRRGVIAWGLATIVTWLMPVIAGALLWQILHGGPISYHLGGWPPPWGIEYRVDILSAFVLLLVSAVSAVMMPFARRSVAFEIEGDSRPGSTPCTCLPHGPARQAIFAKYIVPIIYPTTE
jgi:multicomponent Na+:H+ antiporter subunit D